MGEAEWRGGVRRTEIGMKLGGGGGREGLREGRGRGGRGEGRDEIWNSMWNSRDRFSEKFKFNKHSVIKFAHGGALQSNIDR